MESVRSAPVEPLIPVLSGTSPRIRCNSVYVYGMRRGEPSHACSAGSRAGCSTIPKRGAVSASMLTFSGFLCLNLVLIAVADVIDPALVLWYPFQGNFSNLGLGGGTLSQIGSPVVNASYPGYLTGGSCYFNNPNSASGASPNYFISNTGLTEGSAVTVAVWVLVNNQSFTQSILGLNNAANGPFGGCHLPQHSFPCLPVP